jgi:phage shock protein PspC (stress-responsive transcriptional regulator)
MTEKNWLQAFTKSDKDRLLGGICGGLGESTPLPSWVWRLIFVLLFTIYGTGLFIYILL